MCHYHVSINPSKGKNFNKLTSGNSVGKENPYFRLKYSLIKMILKKIETRKIKC